MINTNSMMLIFGLTMLVFGVIISFYTRMRLRSLGPSSDMTVGGISRPKLSVIVRRNRLRSWKTIALVIALIGVLMTILGFVG